MKKITILHGSTIESALQYLKRQSKIQNEVLCADFNDKVIFSTESIDDAYKRMLAENDGLTLADWEAWFSNPKYDLSEPMAIIHFTNFRY